VSLKFTTEARWTFPARMIWYPPITWSRCRVSFLKALVQYNELSRETSCTIRFNLIHKPLSDLFLIYSERRATTRKRLEWALIAKLTYVFEF